MHRMHRIVVAALALFAASSPALAQGPSIEVSEPGWDFGTRDQGSPGETKVVVVENSGDAPLHITELDVSCGCIQPHFKGHEPRFFKGAQHLDISLGKGETIDLILELHTDRGEGEIKKFVTVTSNDPRRSVLKLPITGKLEPRWWLSESEMLIGEIRHGTGFTRDFRVTVRPDTKLEITAVKVYPGDQFETSLERFEDEKTGEWGWIVTLSTNEREAVGRFEGAILVETDHEPFPRRFIRFAGMVTTTTRVTPDRLKLGTLDAGETVVKKLVVEKTEGAGMRLVSVTCTDPQVSTKFVEKTPGKLYEVEVSVTPDGKNGSVRGTVVVQLDEPGEVLHEIAYYGRVRDT